MCTSLPQESLVNEISLAPGPGIFPLSSSLPQESLVNEMSLAPGPGILPPSSCRKLLTHGLQASHRVTRKDFHSVTVAILAQGTSWAVAVTQAFCSGVQVPGMTQDKFLLLTAKIQPDKEDIQGM